MSTESNARKLFQKDNSAIAQRDRRDFRTFDDMPAGLRRWWVDRARNYAVEGKYGLSDIASKVPMTKEEAVARIADIDAKFEAAKGWGYWMVMVANEREDLANQFGLEHKWQARCGGRRTD